MSRIHLHLRFALVLPPLAALALAIGFASWAQAEQGVASQPCGCPACGHAVCVPSRVPVIDERHCWCVETKQVCIPAIRWPWQSCCEPLKCGKVRTVKVLRKVECECHRCGYQWDAQCLNGCPNGACR